MYKEETKTSGKRWGNDTAWAMLSEAAEQKISGESKLRAAKDAFCELNQSTLGKESRKILGVIAMMKTMEVDNEVSCYV